VIERKITIKVDNQLLIDALVEATELSKQNLKSALDKGCVWLKTDKQISRIRRIKKPLKIGNEVFIYWNEEILSSVPTQPTLILDKKVIAFGLSLLEFFLRAQSGEIIAH